MQNTKINIIKTIIITIIIYLIYLLRWQASTPILAVVTDKLSYLNDFWLSAFIANLIGGLIFFWIDRAIFNKMSYWIYKKVNNIFNKE